MRPTKRNLPMQRLLNAVTRFGGICAGALLCLWLASGAVVQAAPLAGTSITNQASANYVDAPTGKSALLTSNIVVAQVQQVSAFLLSAAQSRVAAPGATVYLPHQIRNTGNGPDSFNLSASALAGGGFTLGSVVVYADANADGLPDNMVPLVTTGMVPVGGSFNVVLAVTVPGLAVMGSSGQVVINAVATATGLPAAQQSNTDTVTVTPRAVLSVTKAFSLVSGFSPNTNGGNHIGVTVTIVNTGNAAASNIQFKDLIGGVNAAPAFNTSGMLYVPGRARWSGSVLSDSGVGNPPGISYSTTNVAGATAINGTISSLAAGATTQIVFAVDVLPGLTAGSARTNNSFSVVYSDGLIQQSVSSNVATYTVQEVLAKAPDLTLTKTHIGGFTVGVPGTFNLVASNGGNADTTGSVTISDVLPAGLSFIPATSGGNGWICKAVGLAVTCSTEQVIPVGGQATVLPISVIPDATAQQASPVVNTAQVAGGGEPAINSRNNSATDVVQVGLAATVSGRVWIDLNHDRMYNSGEPLVPGWQVQLLDANGVTVGSALTNEQGAYSIGPALPGSGYQLRFRDPANGVFYATPVNGESGVPAWPNETVSGGMIQNLQLMPGSNVTEQSLPLEPGGVVYDSISRTPVPGATVKIVGPAGFDPAVHLFGGSANGLQTVGSNGYYQFLLLAGAPAGSYHLEMVAPVGYTAPSTLIPAQPSALTPPSGVGQFLVQTQFGPPAVGSPTTYFLAFNLSAGVRNVINNHIPLDPVLVPGSGLLVSKVASRTTAESGDFVDYTVLIKNTTVVTMPATVLQDSLPRGFHYQTGSARLNNAVLSDPTGGIGPKLSFAIGTLVPGSTATLTYRLAVGVAAPLGNAINRAQAISGVASSNFASAVVQIVQDVFSDKGYILGTVYLDCSKNHFQDDGEQGIPGVRLFLENGTNVLTDGEGKYSIYGISARTHILKIDNSTLPVGAVLEDLGNRNAGVADSRFVDLKNGELHRADFASNRCTPEVLDELKLRQEKARKSETDNSLNYKLNVQAGMVPPADLRALPASGELGVQTPGANVNAVGSFQPLFRDTGLNSGNSNLPALPITKVPTIDLDLLMGDLSNDFDFVDLKDKDVLPTAQTTVRIKGRIGSEFRLVVNGQTVGQDRVGKKSTVADKQLEAWEYIGVGLNPGQNLVEIKQIDPFGNERGSRSISLTAPDQLAHIVVDAPKTVDADGRTQFTVKIALRDKNGVPVTSRTYLTLEATQGRWQVNDIDPKEPGTQVFMEGGKATFTVLPPTQPGEETLRVVSGILMAEHHIAYVPELRPMIIAGLVEGTFKMHSLDAQKLLPSSSNDGFDQQIQSMSRGDGSINAAARTALFLKGKVKGDYLLTLAYDSDKGGNDRLFRDIQPDEFYPVYGDSSTRSFDAQSTSRLFVRIDKGKSYLLYGDFVTQSVVPARSLSQYNRSLTGVKEHFENDKVMVNAFASQDTSRQVIEEIPANGTSGPFQLKNKGALINSELIEVLTRDHNQPTVILRVEPQTRFADYEIEQFTGRILFKGPVPSLDANLNPKSIRVTYEMDQGGASFWVAGIDGQVKINEKLEVGGVAVHDNNPLQPSSLSGVNASLKLAEKTVLVGEVAHSSTILGSGNAERLELRADAGALTGRIYAGRSDAEFTNAASPLSQGNRESGAKGTYRVNESTLISGELISSGNTQSGDSRNGVLLKAEKTLNDTWKVDAGMRKTHEVSAALGAAATDETALLLKATARITSLGGLSVNGELEQDIHDSSQRVAALGAEYQMMNRGRIYARHEFVSTLPSFSTLNSNQLNNTTVIGMDTDYTPNTHLFSEYRARDALDGREAESAIGLRNKWDLRPGLRLNTSVERIVSMAGAPGRAGQSYTGAIEYTADPLWKGSTRLEFHNGDTAAGWLNSIDVARKLNDSWTVIGKEVYSENESKGAATGIHTQERVQAGLAWRDKKWHFWNALGKFEHRREIDTTPGIGIDRRVNILSLHANYQPTSSWQASGHYAVKWVTDQSLGLDSASMTQLASGRVMWDLTERWDAGVTASVMADHSSAPIRYGLGGEMGYLAHENLWLTVGYNLFGFEDPDAIAQSVTDKGMFVRLRFKFDENSAAGIFGKFQEKARPASCACEP